MPDAGKLIDRLSARQRLILRWAALGAVSGLCATLSTFVFAWIDDNFGRPDDLMVGFGLGGLKFVFMSLSIFPGLVFGLIAGFALRRRGLLGGWRYPAYVAASTLSYFGAFELILNYLRTADMLEAGMIAGLFGAGLLTAASAVLIPVFRRARPCLIMIAAGTLLGALLDFRAGNSFFNLLALLLPWQAGFAAAMATAFDRE